MTSDQFHSLLQELARASGLQEGSGLLEHGRVRIGDFDAVLEHEPRYDAKLLQVRVMLGAVGDGERDIIVRGLLEANYAHGYGGECIFSIYPGSEDVVVTLKVRLTESTDAKALWQQLSDVTRHGSELWEGIAAKARPSGGLFQPNFHLSRPQVV